MDRSFSKAHSTKLDIQEKHHNECLEQLALATRNDTLKIEETANDKLKLTCDEYELKLKEKDNKFCTMMKEISLQKEDAVSASQKLKEKVLELTQQNNLTSNELERTTINLQALQREHDEMTSEYNQMLDNSERIKNENKKVKEELLTKTAEYDQLKSCFTVELSKVSEGHTQELRRLQEEYAKVKQTLVRQFNEVIHLS
jgi:hypothetical protein